MTQKAICPKCESEFLQITADSNDGYCLKCRPNKKSSIDHAHVAEKMELGLRLLLAIVFGFVFAGMGYGAGSVIWAGIGIALSLAFFPVGFVYGFFCSEINPIIRSFFRSLLHFGSE